MPHGSRLSPDGTRHFSCAMMSDELIELDAVGLEVVRRMALTDGTGRRSSRSRGDEEHGGGDGHHVAITKPTWVQPHPRKNLAYVALNGAHQVVEVDLEKWRIVAPLPHGPRDPTTST